MKARIVEVTHPDGEVEYVIQQRHFLFRWQWVSAWVNSWAGAACQDTFSTLEEARKHLCFFDGTRSVGRVVSSSEHNAENQALTRERQ
jgi:hypothetical protein